MVKRIAFILVLVIMIQAFAGLTVTASVPFRDLAAQSAILVEKDSGTVLFQQNAHTRHPADGLAKIMTLLLASYAVENDVISDNELVTMTEAAWLDLEDYESPLNILPGEEMTFIDLMYSAYVGNAREANNMLAIRIARSVDAFVDMMNITVLDFGAENTRFVNPHGRFHSGQYTTAFDQYLIFKEAMNSALFAEVAGTFRHITEAIYEYESRTFTSSNLLINPSSRHYVRHCVAGRDSSSFEGGYSLVAFADDDRLALISVVLGSYVHVFEDESTDTRSFSETVRLFHWGNEQFSWRDILKTTDLLARVPVMHGAGADFVNARPESSVTLLLNEAVETESFIRDVTIYSIDNDEPLVAPINAGEVLGEVVVTRDGVEYARLPLVANTNISLNGIEFIRRQIMDMLATDIARNIIIVLVAVLLLYIALVIRYNIVRINRMRKIRNAKKELIDERQQNFKEW